MCKKNLNEKKGVYAMKKVGSVVLMLILLLSSMSLTTYAYGGNYVDSSTQYEKLRELQGQVIVISPKEKMIIKNVTAIQNVKNMWLYEIDAIRSRDFDIDDDIPPTMNVQQLTDMKDSKGNYVMASGVLKHTGTAFNFPCKGKKQATYEGKLRCYVD